MVFIVELQHDLGVAGMRRLGRQRIPEAWGSAAYESCERFHRHLLRGRNLLDYFLDLRDCRAGRRERRIFREKDVDEGEVRQILGEELRFQQSADIAAAGEHAERSREHNPAVSDGPVTQTKVGAGEARDFSLLHFCFTIRPQNVGAQ